MAATKMPYLQVLIAEKEPDIQAVYRRYFDFAGLQPVIVDSGRECLDALFANNAIFDIVIIDTHLIDIDGISLAKKIRERIHDQQIIVTTTVLNGKTRELEAMGIEGLEKPFSFARLLSMMKPKLKPSPIDRIVLSDHVLGIYENREQHIQDAIRLLKGALANNESFAYIMADDIDVNDLKARIKQEVGIDADGLVSEGSLFLINNVEWYFGKDGKKVDIARIAAKWNGLIDFAAAKGKKGLRTIGSPDCFFDHGWGKEVVDYDCSMPAKFSIPFAAVCGYRKQDIDKLSEDQLKRLLVCHSHVWTGNR